MRECNVKKRKKRKMILSIISIIVLCFLINHIMIADLLYAILRDIGTLLMIALVARFVKKYEVEEIASRNSLTGLYKKERLNSDLHSRCEQKKDFVYVLADLNDFKKVNDIYNHENGDSILFEFGGECNELQENSDSDVTCYHVGGDEFAFLIDENFEQYLEKIDRLRKQVSRHKKSLHMENDTYDFSYGAIRSRDIFKQFGYDCDTDEVVQRVKETADNLMYQFKRNQKVKGKII